MFRPDRLLLLIAIMIWSATVIVACSRPPDEPTPTLAPTAEAASPLATPITDTALPPTNTPIPPTPTPQPTPTPCQHAVQSDLAAAWNPDELGCPIGPGAAAISTAYAPFEGGQMLWRGDTDVIYVLTHDGRWTSLLNEWREGDPVFTCGEENPATTPVRGFGRVWCDQAGIRGALGNATAEEIGDGASAVQDFVNGTILIAPFGDVFVFVGEDGRWRRVEE